MSLPAAYLRQMRKVISNITRAIKADRDGTYLMGKKDGIVFAMEQVSRHLRKNRKRERK